MKVEPSTASGAGLATFFGLARNRGTARTTRPVVTSSTTIDQHGFLRGFAYHDGTLDGVLLRHDGAEALLAIRSVGGERRIVTLRGLKMMSADGLRQGNIINTIRLLTPSCVMNDESLQSRVRAQLDVDLARIDTDSSIFLLDTSYGVDLVAICATVDVGDGALSAPGDDGFFFPLAEEIAQLEKKRMLQALEATRWNQLRAAHLLAVPRRTFITKMKLYAIRRPTGGHDGGTRDA